MKYILSVLLALVSIQSYGAIIFRGDFESGTIVKPGGTVDSFWQNVAGPGCTLTNDTNAKGTYNAANDIHLVTSPKRAGNYAVSILTRRLCDYRTINGTGEQKGREEILIQQQSLKQYLNTVYWVGFSFYIPTSYNIETNDQAITSIFQQKILNTDQPQGTAGYSKSCCQHDFGLNGANVHFEIENLYTAGSTVSTRTKQTEEQRSYDWPITKGVWTDVQLKYRMCNLAMTTAGTCSPLYELYVNVNGAQSTTPVKTWTVGANSVAAKENATDPAIFIAGPKASIYKYGYNCTIAGPNYPPYTANPISANSAQKDFAWCTTQVNGNSRNSTNNLTSVNVFFDEILIGDASSSLAEIAPHVFDTPVTPTGVSVIGMNLGNPVPPNTPATINDNPITFTTNGGDTSGVSRITVASGGITEDMPAIKSNSTGGFFYTGPFTNITDPNAMFTFYYDNTMQVDTEGAQPLSGWLTDGVTIAPYDLPEYQDFGVSGGVTITNETAAYKALKTGEIAITAGQTVKIRSVAKPGTSNAAKLRVKSRVSATSLYVACDGTLGSLQVDQTPAHGTNHTCTETVRNGLHFIEWTYTANQTGFFEFLVGPNTSVINDTLILLSVQVWLDQTYATPLTFNRTLALTDVTPPDIFNCTFGSPTSGNLSYTCNLSETGGDVKLVVTSSSVSPSKAQIAACDDDTNVNALVCQTLPAATLAISGTATGVNPYVDKYLYAYQTDTVGLESSVTPADEYIPAESTVIKRIKFLSNTARLRTITGAEYTGPLDFFLLTNSDPRLPGTKNDLVYIDNPSISNGVINFTETNVQCATCTGSINALEPGQYWYSARSEDGSVKSVYTINVVAE